MTDSTNVSLALAIVCLILVTLLTLPSLWQCILRLQKSKDQYESLSGHYEDEDGIATDESESAYSDFIQRLIILLVSAVGSLDALALAVLTTRQPEFRLLIEQWLQFATWVSQPTLFSSLLSYSNRSS